MKTPLVKFLLFFLVVSPIVLFGTSFSDENNEQNENQKKKHSSFEIPSYANVFSTESTFLDAKSDLLEAITNNGLVISYISHAKNMLENTAIVSGITKPVYSDAEIYLFCKANLSHNLVAGNPHNIVLCPYSIAIYVLTDEPERVYLSYRKVETSDKKVKALTQPIEGLLIQIIEEVI